MKYTLLFAGREYLIDIEERCKEEVGVGLMFDRPLCHAGMGKPSAAAAIQLFVSV